MDNDYDPDVHLLLTAVIADLEIVSDELRALDVDEPALWAAHRLRTINSRTGNFDLAVRQALDGVAAAVQVDV